MNLTRPLLAPLALTAILAVPGCDRAASPEDSFEVAAKGMHAAALSSHGELSLIGSIYHGGSLWHNRDQARTFNWNHKAGALTTIVAADFSLDGYWALSADPFTVVLWNTSSGAGDRYWTAPGEILDVELGPGANTALLGLSDHSAVIFDIRRGGVRRTFAHNNRVRSVDLSNDGRLALTGSEDYTACLWDVESGEKLVTFKHEDDVQLVKLSGDGSLALSVSKYDKAIIWRTANGEVLGEIPLAAENLRRGLRFTSARFSDDNRLLLTGRPDQRVDLWEVASLRNITHWQLPKRSIWKPTGAAVLDVAFGEGANSYYAIASNGFVHTLASKEGAEEEEEAGAP